MTGAIFSPGTVVSNRNRLWRVDAQMGDVLVVTPMDGGEAEQRQFYLPLEDVRPGHVALPDASRVGFPSIQDLLLRAYRLSLLHGTAPLLSLQRSRVIPKDYQLVPVVMALEMPRVRMLIADDVGLGKTIEAGLILTELLARQLASRVLVIVPASLREQWREALDYFFHIPARIISSRHRREMERELPLGANPWSYYRCLITSTDYAKQPAIKNQILEQQWDVVVIDEAHQVAKPHQRSPDERPQMDRWELAHALATSSRVRHLLLLTATPHNGYTDSFASLLQMLDVGAVSGPPHEPCIERSVAARHVCQRRRADVEEWLTHRTQQSPFPKRDQREVIVAPSAYEKEAVDAVEAYGKHVLDSAAAGTIQMRTMAHWTVLHLHKRALSSPEALRCSLRNRRDSLLRRLEGRAQAEDEAMLPLELLRANVLDEDTGERVSDEEAGQRAERAVYGPPEAIKRELEQLEVVIQKAAKITPGRDSKLQKLLDATLPECLRRDPKVILFTRFVDTLRYLEVQIRADPRYADVTVLTIYGSMNERQRMDVFKDFERPGKRILIATDAISEGINLQYAASQVIHYELPWNPNRLEQRNGRVDRFGQPKPVVHIRTMVMDETLDASILNLLVKKAAQIRKDYGFAPPYFGDETSILQLIEQHEVVGTKQLSLFDDWRPPETVEAPDPFAKETLDRIKDESFYGQTHISLPQIEQRLRETEETVGSAEQIREFVFSALKRFNCPVRENPDGSWRIGIVPALQTASVGGVIDRATFDAEWGTRDPDVTVLDLGHPLVRKLIEEVKQSAFRDAEHYGRTAYMITPETREVTALFHLLVRFVVNTKPVSIVEELLPVAVPVYGGPPLSPEQTRRLLRAKPVAGRRTDGEVREALSDALAREGLDDILADAVEARRQQLTAERRAMREHLERQQGALAAEWMRGIDDLSRGSFDVLTVTIYFPE